MIAKTTAKKYRDRMETSLIIGVTKIAAIGGLDLRFRFLLFCTIYIFLQSKLQYITRKMEK